MNQIHGASRSFFEIWEWGPSRSLSTPGVKPLGDGEDDEACDEEELSKEEKTGFRFGAARCIFQSVDIPDITFPTKELCRLMSSPKKADVVALKRMCWYLKGRPRLVQLKPSEPRFTGVIQVYFDSGWAGCRRARKSSNGGCIIYNGACLKLWSSMQAARAWPSGEAEYHVAFEVLAFVPGFERVAQDLGRKVAIQLCIESVAALWIIRRRGLGKVRHIDTGYLWLQDMVAAKRLQVRKAKGTANPFGLGAKHLESEDIDSYLRTSLFIVEADRFRAVPGI